MNTTPSWEAARNGLPGDLNVTNHANQVDQLLGTHGITALYTGSALVTPSGGANFTWLSYGTTTDLDQPFTLPGGHTSIGRVIIPVNPVGNGADLLVGLYPDNGSGAPNTASLLSGTVIPASWINNLSAPSGISNGGPLATARFNTLYMSGGFTQTTWAAPSGGPGGSATTASQTTSGNFIITAGGSDPASNVSVATVVTSQYAGGGVEQLSVPQPSLPVGTEGGVIAATASALVYAGGGTQPTVGGSVVTPVAAVWTASWNPNTGAIGSWSAQTSLPQPAYQCSGATYNNTVYVVGGQNNTGTLNTVYYATINNGQISAWSQGSALPTAVILPTVAVIGNWLIVVGGLNAGSNTGAYYAPLNPDGSPGAWNTAPSLPSAVSAYNSGWNAVTAGNVMALLTGTTGGIGFSDAVQMLTFTATGPADQWYSTHWSHATAEQYGAFARGDGGYDLVALNYPNNYYEYTKLVPVPMLSVPLPATGLTAGAVYHVVLQQRPSGSSSSYLQYGITNAALTADALKSSRHSGTWVTAQSGYSMPMSVYDNTATGAILHTWEDPTSTGSAYTSNLAARASTLLYNQYQLPIGLCEATNLPNDPLNSNPTFTSGTSPWTATNCTLAQSSAQTHGGFAFSGLMTPNGTSATVFVQSENVPINSGTAITNPGRFYQVNGWVYSSTGWSSVSVSINWYDRTGTYLSTSSNPVSVPAATWTNLVNYFNPPLGAAQAAIVPTESGTPGVTNTLYLSNVTLTAASELTTTAAPVSQITYASVWTPTSVTQLA